MAAPQLEERCLKFDLLDLDKQNLSEFLLNIKDEKVSIVSVIGKSSLNSPKFKEHVIADALGKNIFQNEESEKYSTLCDIPGYYDSATHTIFLELSGISDTSHLVQTCKEMENELKKKNFLELWCDLQFPYAKALLMLFSISHIIVVVLPNASFDLSYIYLFRTLDIIRLKALPWLRELLTGIEVSNDWVQAGRPCSPRVLFVFETCPLTHDNVSDARYKPKKHSSIKKLEHSLEDQIYRILRKSRVITNISGNSLFAVPANQEFVYMFETKPYISDFVGFYLTQLSAHCQLAREKDLTDARGNGATSVVFENNSFMDSLPSASDNSEHSFSKFLFQHINLALNKGFDDNVGRYPIPAFFELPLAHTWFEIASKISSAIQSDSKDKVRVSYWQTFKRQDFVVALKSALDTDVMFSEGRCGKVLPIASAAYQENLPTHYTEEYHETRLAHALQVFSMHARGPAVHRFVQQLKEDCERLWKSGHQMCEVLSLTGNHCMNPIHRTEDEEDKTLPIMPHCSQIKLVSTCDCGCKQATRDDPFHIKAANHDFYATQANQCCRDLEKVDFPIFRTSSSPSVSPTPVTLPNEISEEKKEDSAKTELSEGNSDENSLPNEMEQLTMEDQSESQADDERDEIVISIHDDAPKDRSLVRQPSTTEYLQGMLHSESRPGLLPTFSSWSLKCLGPSSLYSHNIGLQDQPGFIPGTNYLLPWDVTVKLEHKERWPALWEGKRPLSLKAKKAIRDGPQFNVKIFIGVEYECCRGHRFMCSGPDRVLRVTSSGHVKDNALKVTGSDMPLYFPCPCRSSKPQIAQLMRIHVVTPKAPVHVTLNPKVQPSPDPCPIFFPTLNEPLKLSQSAYWVLRLPFVYEGELGPYLPPREPMPVEACRLLKGTYNIVELHPNR